MTAEALARALGGRRSGATWMARCPAHRDTTPSLSISVGKNAKVLVCCHAGCAQREVIAALNGRGLWDGSLNGSGHSVQTRGKPIETNPAPYRTERAQAALALWQASDDIRGTAGEAYLRSRAITMAPPPSLRFHPRLKHPSGRAWPAMLALVVNAQTASPVAIHRTFLARDGQGKAPVDPPKMMLGPCRGGAVRLAEPSDILMVGEGIETCLAAMQLMSKPAWAALSTSGLRSLVLPRSVLSVIVLADGDPPGEAAAQDCARRWKREGRRVQIARPPSGMDFNDLLVNASPDLTEAAQ